MRKSIDGLDIIVQMNFKLDPLTERELRWLLDGLDIHQKWAYNAVVQRKGLCEILTS